jgi:hypothetical protein
MSANFYAAILCFTIAAAGTLAISRIRGQIAPWPNLGEEPVRLPLRFSLPKILLAIGIVGACIVINIVFW